MEVQRLDSSTTKPVIRFEKHSPHFFVSPSLGSFLEHFAKTGVESERRPHP